MAYYSEFNLAPSQCAEWIIDNSSNLLTHTVAGFGWMEQRHEEVNIYHIVQMRNNIARVRELLGILEAFAVVPNLEPYSQLLDEEVG